MATLLSDNFDRANSATAVGSPQVGPAPVAQSGTAGISSNQFYAVSSNPIITWDLGTPNVEMSFTGGTMNSGTINIILGYASSTDFYQILFSSASPTILYKFAPGGSVALYTSSVKLPATNGSVCKAHYRDGIIRVYVDDVMVIRWQLDTPITANLHGLKAAASNPKADNLLGTDAPTITESTLTGGLQSNGLTFNETDPYLEPSFIYRGRDTKIQDTAAGA